MDGDVWWLIRNDETPELRAEVHTNQRNEVGGSFCGAALIAMHDTPITFANYYDAQCLSNWCGMFDSYSIPQKPFYAFKAYNALYRNCDHAVPSSTAGEGLYCLAGSGTQEWHILLASFRGSGDYVEIDMQNLGEGRKKAEVYILDKEHNLTLDRVEYYTGERVLQILRPARYAVCWIRITNE